MDGLTTPISPNVSGRAGGVKWTTASASTLPASCPVSHSILIWPAAPDGITRSNLAVIPASESSTRSMVNGAAPSLRRVNAWTTFSACVTVPKSWLWSLEPPWPDRPLADPPARQTTTKAASDASLRGIWTPVLASLAGRRTGMAAGPFCAARRTLGVEDVEAKLGQFQSGVRV